MFVLAFILLFIFLELYNTKVCLVMGDADPWAAGTAEPGRISSPHFHRRRCDG